MNESCKNYIIKYYKANYKYYLLASILTNVPPSVLAAVHYRESAMSLKTPGPGGIMQFDPPLSKNRIINLINKYCAHTAYKDKIIDNGQYSPLSALVLAGCFIQDKLTSLGYSQLYKHMTYETSSDIIAKALWYYNGAVQSTYKNSPYVYNQMDASHSAIRIIGSVIGNNGKRIKINRIDTRPGALTIVKMLDSTFKIDFASQDTIDDMFKSINFQ